MPSALLADWPWPGPAHQKRRAQLHTQLRRPGGLQERLWVESGSSTPHLRGCSPWFCREPSKWQARCGCPLGSSPVAKRVRIHWWKKPRPAEAPSLALNRSL